MDGGGEAGASPIQPGSARKRRRAVGSAENAPCTVSLVQPQGGDLDDLNKPCRSPKKPQCLLSAPPALSPPPGARGTIRSRRGAALVAATGGVVPVAEPSGAGGSSALADGEEGGAAAAVRQPWGLLRRPPRSPQTVISPSRQRLPATARLQKQIPEDHELLLEMFAALHGVVAVMRRRGQRCTFEALKAAIEQQSKRRFEIKHLAQLKHIYPDALHWEHIAVPRAAPGMQGNSPRVDVQLVVDVRCDAPASDLDAYGSPTVTVSLRSGTVAAALSTSAASLDSPSSAAKRRLFSADDSQPAATAAAAADSAGAPGNRRPPAMPLAGGSGRRGSGIGNTAQLPEGSWRAELGRSPAASAEGGIADPQQGTPAETPQRTMLAMREEMAHRLALDYAAQYRAFLEASGRDAAGVPLDAEQWARDEELWARFHPQPVPEAPLPPLPDTSSAAGRHSGGGYLTPSPLAPASTPPLPPTLQGKAAAAPPGQPHRKARRLSFGVPGGPMPVHSRFAAVATDAGLSCEAAAGAGAPAPCSDESRSRQQAPLSAPRGYSPALAAALRDHTGDGSDIPDSVWQAVAAGQLPVSLRAVEAARRNEAAGQRAHGEDAVAARRRQNAESKLLEAYRFLRSQFQGGPRVQSVAKVVQTMSTNGKFGDAAACKLQLRVLQQAAPGWLTQQADRDGTTKLAINRALTAPSQPKVMAAMEAATVARRQGRAMAVAAAQPGRGQGVAASAAVPAAGPRVAHPCPADAIVALSAAPNEAPAAQVHGRHRVRFAAETAASPSDHPSLAEPHSREALSAAGAQAQLQADAESPSRAPAGSPRPTRPLLRQVTLPTGRRTPLTGTPRKLEAGEDEAAGSGGERRGFGLGGSLFLPDMRS